MILHPTFNNLCTSMQTDKNTQNNIPFIELKILSITKLN